MTKSDCQQITNNIIAISHTHVYRDVEFYMKSRSIIHVKSTDIQLEVDDVDTSLILILNNATIISPIDTSIRTEYDKIYIDYSDIEMIACPHVTNCNWLKGSDK